MGGHAPYVVPKHTTFKSIEGIAQLEELQKALAVKGLKDPWIRNEIWRYRPQMGNKTQNALKLFFRGFPAGLVLAIGTAAIGKALGGGGHGGHEEHDKEH